MQKLLQVYSLIISCMILIIGATSQAPIFPPSIRYRFMLHTTNATPRTSTLTSVIHRLWQLLRRLIPGRSSDSNLSGTRDAAATLSNSLSGQLLRLLDQINTKSGARPTVVELLTMAGSSSHYPCCLSPTVVWFQDQIIEPMLSLCPSGSSSSLSG